MTKIILSLVWVILAAIPTLNAQQVSPSQPTTAQQLSRAKVTGTRSFPKPRVQPTQATTADHNPGNDKPAVSSPGNGNTIDNNVGRGKTTNDNHNNYADAKRRHHHERHDCDWWKQHYIVIVLVGGGYYYQDSGYWYPAWGYNPNYERYEYDGPIYTYGNLLPDQVIINVQNALKALGYYEGDVNGSLGASTRRALSAYQQAYGLDATGVVDEPTVRALGLI